MEHISSPSSAPDSEMVKMILEKTEIAALRDAAEGKKKVADVGSIQRQKIIDILGAKGSDGDALMGEDMQEGLKERHEQRMKAIAPAPDAYVLPDDDMMVGVQYDDTRAIGIAGRALTDDRVAKHEAKHRTQEQGDQSVDLPPTGDPALDRMRTLSRRALRENGAIAAEGGLKNHTPEYFGYVQSSNDIAAFLDQHGMNGKSLVEDAGDTNAGFDTLHESIVSIAIRERINNAMSEQLAA